MSLNTNSRAVQGKALIFEVVESRETRSSNIFNYHTDTTNGLVLSGDYRRESLFAEEIMMKTPKIAPMSSKSRASIHKIRERPFVHEKNSNLSKTEREAPTSIYETHEKPFAPKNESKSRASSLKIRERPFVHKINLNFSKTEREAPTSMHKTYETPFAPKNESKSRASIQETSKTLFASEINSIVKTPLLLKTTFIKKRFLQPCDAYGLFIENTNLSLLPRNCLGTLIAYSLEQVRISKKSFYNLGVLVYLHPYCAIIAPINYSNPSHPYGISHDLVTIDFEEEHCLSSIVYLNRIEEETCGSDGFI